MKYALLTIFTFVSYLHSITPPMFIGEYPTQLGEKNRIAIPKKLRDEFEGKVIITRGYEKCLLLVDNKRWKYLLEDINSMPLLNMNVRDTKRYLLGGAVEIDPDSQGRFVLPENLRLFANIEKEVTFLGVGEWIEVWGTDDWENKLTDLSDNASEIADRLKQ